MATHNAMPELADNRHRLPSLNEVLSRRTLAPVDLFSFYIYMRDQQRSVDYLDFWLDVLQHMSLCRHYVRELRRSVLIDSPHQDKASKRSSMKLEQFGQLDDSAQSGMADSEKLRDQTLSAYLRSEPDDSSPHGSLSSEDSLKKDRLRRSQDTPHFERPRPQFLGQDTPAGLTTDSESPAQAIARADLRASAEKILYTFLLSGSEREIILPRSILNDIIISIEDEHRDDPEVFDAAKDYVFQAMERDAFPGFLRAKALGNLVPASELARRILGLLAMFGGFWAAFACIFLNLSRTTRCWLILPFSIGVYMLASDQYALDPVMALVGFSEYTFFSWHKIKDPYVRELLIKRGVMVLGVTVLIAACILVLFIFVPGKRL